MKCSTLGFVRLNSISIVKDTAILSRMGTLFKKRIPNGTSIKLVVFTKLVVTKDLILLLENLILALLVASCLELLCLSML